MIKPGALIMAAAMTAVAAGTYFGLDMLKPGTIPPPFGRVPPVQAHVVAGNTVAEPAPAVAPAPTPAPVPAPAASAPAPAASGAAPTEQELAEEPAPKAEPAAVASATSAAAPKADPKAEPKPEPKAEPKAEPKVEAAAAEPAEKPVPRVDSPRPKAAAAPAPQPEPAPVAAVAEPKPEPAPKPAPTATASAEPAVPMTVSNTTADSDVIKQWWPDPTKLPANQLKLQYAGDVQGETAIGLLFSEAPNLDSLKLHGHVREISGAEVTGAWSAGKNPRLVVFRGLKAGTRYTVILDKELADARGFALGQTLQGPVYIPKR